MPLSDIIEEGTQKVEFPKFPWEIKLSEDGGLNILHDGYTLEGFMQMCSMTMLTNVDFINGTTPIDVSIEDCVLKAAILAKKLGFDPTKVDSIYNYATDGKYRKKLKVDNAFLQERINKYKER